jgi:hypothetical protein
MAGNSKAGAASEHQKPINAVVEQHLFFAGVNMQLFHTWRDGIATDARQPASRPTNIPPGSGLIAPSLNQKAPSCVPALS